MLDSFTLAIAATVGALGFSLSMHMLRYLIPQEQSLRYWSTSSLLTVLGMLLQSQRGNWPDELTWLLANTLVMTAGALFWQGSAALAEHPLPGWTVPAVAILSGTVNLAVHIGWPTDHIRICVLSTAMACCFAGAGWMFWRLSRLHLKRTARLTSGLMWLGCLMFAARLNVLDDVSAQSNHVSHQILETLVPYMFAILFFGWSTTFVAFVVGDKLRHRLETALSAAERSDLAKSAFLASITHELRTPLNAISGFAQLMTHEEHYPSEVRQSALLIQNAGNQLLDVVNDLMDLRALQEGTLQFNFDVCRIQQLIDQALQDWHAVAQRENITLRIRGVATNPTVWVDPVRVKQVIRNLVSNAIKFNHRGGEVRVEWFDDGVNVVLSVSDTGPGIPAHLHSRLFEAFDRLGAESGEVAGTGIGLTICHRLVHMMGGRIDFHNNPDMGCTFKVRFPQVAVVNGEVVVQTAGVTTADTDPNFASTQRIDQQAQAIPQGKQVLYIEDNLTNQKLVQAVFQKQLGLDVTLALTAEEGLVIARERLPNLILMDLNLPGMDGYSALKALRTDPRTRTIPVMAVTAQSQPEDLERGRAAGFDAYLTKPLKLGNLIAQAMKLLKR